MRKPKIKKRKLSYFVYLKKSEMFQCFDKQSALFYYELLKHTQRKKENPTQ